MRLVLDSNFYFSLALGGIKTKKIWQEIIIKPEIELCLFSEHFSEIKAKLFGDKIRQFLGVNYNENLMQNICNKIAESHFYFHPNIKIELCTDKDDNFILELAFTAGANFIITNDKQLLKLNPFENTSIITISQFYESLKNLN